MIVLRRVFVKPSSYLCTSSISDDLCLHSLTRATGLEFFIFNCTVCNKNVSLVGCRDEVLGDHQQFSAMSE